MKGKAMLLVGAAIGYVLGAKAGRQRYETIKAKGQDLWQNPKVQEQVSHAQEIAREKAPDMQQKLAEATSKVSAVVSEKLHGDQTVPETLPSSTSSGGAHRSA